MPSLPIENADWFADSEFCSSDVCAELRKAQTSFGSLLHHQINELKRRAVNQAAVRQAQFGQAC